MAERADQQRGREAASASAETAEQRRIGATRVADVFTPATTPRATGLATWGAGLMTPPNRLPRGAGRVMARARPGAIPLPASSDLHAFTPPKTFDRWSVDAAGVRAVAKGDNVIAMFDVIGQDYWTGGGITAKSVTAQLRAIGDRPVEVQINSPGGDMFEGIAIYNVLREHPQSVTVKVMGMAASAASVIAMAGNTVEIGAASFLMIHNCWVVAMGNRFDLLDVAAYLEPFDQAMADVYAQRSGQDASQCAAWMTAETWMSGSAAIERGFADALLPADAVKTDAATKAEDRRLSDLRALEISLMSSMGLSRTDARAKIKSIRGTTDSASPSGTTDSSGTASDAAVMAGLADLLATFRAA